MILLVGLGVPNFKPAGDEKVKKAALPSPPVSTAHTLLSKKRHVPGRRQGRQSSALAALLFGCLAYYGTSICDAGYRSIFGRSRCANARAKFCH